MANADVAELHATLTPNIKIEDDVHIINIATKRALTATEFKQMFYARGDDEFSIANVYECPNIGSNILASVWGKRIQNDYPLVQWPVIVSTSAADDTLVFSPSMNSGPEILKINTAIRWVRTGGGTTNIVDNKVYYIVGIDAPTNHKINISP